MLGWFSQCVCMNFRWLTVFMRTRASNESHSDAMILPTQLFYISEIIVILVTTILVYAVFDTSCRKNFANTTAFLL